MTTYEAAIPGTIWNETERHVVQVNGVWQLAPGQADAPYVNDPNDPGGPTKWGQSQRQIQLDTGRAWSVAEIQALTVDYVVRRWKPIYWLFVYEAITAQIVASKIFDIDVNANDFRGVELVQGACCDLGQVINIDGGFGIHTLAAVNALDAQALVNATAKRQLAFYYSLNNPKEMPGWIVRARYLTTKGTI